MVDGSQIPADLNPWYNNKLVLCELSKQLRNKYCSVRKPVSDGRYILVRYLLGYHDELLKKSVAHYGGFKFGFKFYFDLAHWSKTPMMSYDSDIRDLQRNEFNNDWKQYFIGYDYAIDLDAPDKNPETAYKEAKIIKNYFDNNKIPYYVQFSGSKGFHFVIPWYYMPRIYKPLNVPNKCAELSEFITERFNLKCMDLSIYDHRRVLKLAYSMDGDKVVLPLSDEQFDFWSLNQMKASVVWHNVKIMNRGLLIRKHNLTDAELKDNVRKLFKLQMVE